MIDRVVDRDGHVWATLEWSGDRLVSLRVPGASIDGNIVDDPLLGRAHVITSGESSTTMSAIDWARPTRIPTVADPAKLAGGAGAMIMNVIAMLAQGPCRYAGRYPTSALYRTLLRSFRCSSSEEQFISHFRLAGSEVEIPIDFTPASFERLGNPHGFVEMRDGLIERAVVDRVTYEIGGSPARFVRAASNPSVSNATSDDLSPRGITSSTSYEPSLSEAGRAELWFGDSSYAEVARFDMAGRLVEGPHPMPRLQSEVLGRSFPAALVGALAELVADAVPAPIADDARRYLVSKTIRWADLGPQAAAITPDGIAVHAVLWDRIAPLGLGRVALALAEALAPVVTRALVREIARRAQEPVEM